MEMSVLEKALRKSEEERRKLGKENATLKEILDSMKPQKPPPTNYLYILYLVGMIAVGVAGAWLVKKALLDEEKSTPQVTTRQVQVKRITPQKVTPPQKQAPQQKLKTQKIASKTQKPQQVKQKTRAVQKPKVDC